MKILAAILLALSLASAAAAADDRQVLPTDVVPSHYDLTLSPDAESLTFKGRVAIDVDASARTPQIILNAKGLTFDSAKLDRVEASAVTVDAALGRATLRFPADISPGAHKLVIAYHGPITRGTFGFFAMDYDSPMGKRRTLATNFEPAGARMLLPCWDEPARKATFSMSIDAPSDRTAVANMPVEAITPLPGGLHRVRFATTPRMSTYLLFVTVGDYERIHREVDGVDVGVVVERGDLARAAYGLEQAAALLHYYNDWYGVRFPLPKLDLIAAPGQIVGGSMENWGSIFYSQNHLLFDPKTSPSKDRQSVFLVISHEMAHQWFGDLVTMAWWNDLWLNEGFARWMQTHAADRLHPEWRTGLNAQSIFDRGKTLDATPASHPVLQPVRSAEQATQAFDDITYDKGAAVITMLEAYIGPEAFRDGVRRYMRAHAYGNTVDDDLWREMPVTAGKPVLEIEHDFTRQAGLPLIRVDATTAGTVLTVGRFRDDASAGASSPPSWRIPLVVRTAGRAVDTLLLNGSASAPAVDSLVNAGALTYARVAYAEPQARALAARLPSLADVDRLNLMNDATALGRAGYSPAYDALAYISRLPSDADPIVWTRAITLLVALDRAHPPGLGRVDYRRWALGILAPVASGIGRTEREGEDPNLGVLRTELLLAQATFGDSDVVVWARSLRASRKGSAADRQTALQIVALDSDAVAFNLLLAEVRAEHDPLERYRLLTALALVGDSALAGRFTAVALGPDAPAGVVANLLSSAAAANPDAVWGVLSDHLDDPAFPIDDQDTMWAVPEIASMSSRPERIAQLRAWANKHLPADTRQQEQAAESTITQNARFRSRSIPEIDRWIAAEAQPR